MCKKFKLGVIGAGFMASAVIKGAINGKVLTANQIIVSDVNQAALDNLKNVGVNATMDNAYLANNAEYVLFAVKPQSLQSVIAQIKQTSCDKFISIMAGVKKQKIKIAFPGSKVARCMPNTPCAIGFGAIGADVSDYTEQKDLAFIKSLLESLSSVVYLDESLLNAVTGVSGSAPAYYYLFAKSIIEAGVNNGLDYEKAKILAVNTMIGAGKMILNNPDKSIDDLITAVCSKGGTTIEAVKTYNEGGLSKLTDDAVKACVNRAEELDNL